MKGQSYVLSPDCRDGNHRKCDEKAWDEKFDEPAVCCCDCHD